MQFLRNSAAVIALTMMFGSVPVYADGDTETTIKLGRASVLLDRATEGASKLLDANRSSINGDWSDELQNKAADYCAFVQKKLEQEKLEDEVSLCSVE